MTTKKPGSFDSVAAFTMLHHIPTRPLEAQLLSEAVRVLRPGGVLFGSDSLHSDELHDLHHDDTYNPIEPATLRTLFEVLGYVAITIQAEDGLTFAAHKPPSWTDAQHRLHQTNPKPEPER